MNIAIDVDPLEIVTLLVFAAPLAGRQLTVYEPGLSETFKVDVVPFEAPFTENAQEPPTATAINVPFAPPDGAASSAAAEGGAAGRAGFAAGRSSTAGGGALIDAFVTGGGGSHTRAPADADGAARATGGIDEAAGTTEGAAAKGSGVAVGS